MTQNHSGFKSVFKYESPKTYLVWNTSQLLEMEFQELPQPGISENYPIKKSPSSPQKRTIFSQEQLLCMSIWDT